MGQNPLRIGRSILMSEAIEGQNGWNRDPHSVPGAPQAWVERFPGLPFVADGREETGMTRKGRGTTAYDLFRSDGIRVDFLSLKSDLIAADGKLPAKVELSTGNRDTLDALMDGINRGASLYTVIFCSENDEFGNPSPEGFCLMLDLAPILRLGITPIGGGPYPKGKAPPCYFRWSSPRKTGESGNGAARDREFLAYPHVDEQGRLWESPTKVCYQELTISLSTLGYKRKDWIPCNVNELAGMIDAADWNLITWGAPNIG